MSVHVGNIVINWGLTAIALIGVIAVELFVILFPIAKILRRMGLSGSWSLLSLTGIGAIIGPRILAYSRWPAVDQTDISN
jgi:hypothetical protein